MKFCVEIQNQVSQEHKLFLKQNTEKQLIVSSNQSVVYTN